MTEQAPSHPTNDPSLPSFKHPALVDLEEDLRRAHDCWENLRGCKGDYLPKEPGEPGDAYEARLERAVFTSFYSSAIKAFSGILSRFSLKNPPKSFADAEQNIDREGNSVKQFFDRCDSHVMRDGGKLLVVEMPPGVPGSAGEEAATGRVPYLCHHNRAVTINWRTTIEGGVEVVKWVVITESTEVPDGEYGVKIEPRYRVIGPGWWKLIKLEAKKGKGPAAFNAIVEKDGLYLDHRQEPLPIVPVVWYSSDGDGFAQGSLPLRQVAEHCLEHYRTRSDLAEKTHKCAMPVPVRVGEPPPPPGAPQQECVIGPNSFIDLPTGGSFTFAEPAAGSLAEQRSQVEHIERLIQHETLSFVYGSSGEKSATQAGLEAAQTQAAIKRMAEQKHNAIQRVFEIWCLYTGEPADPDWGISIDAQVFDRPLTLQDAKFLMDLTGGEPILSQESAIEELQRGGLNRATSSVKDEQKRLRDEAPNPAGPLDRNAFGGVPGIGDQGQPTGPAPAVAAGGNLRP